MENPSQANEAESGSHSVVDSTYRSVHISHGHPRLCAIPELSDIRLSRKTKLNASVPHAAATPNCESRLGLGTSSLTFLTTLLLTKATIHRHLLNAKSLYPRKVKVLCVSACGRSIQFGLAIFRNRPFCDRLGLMLDENPHCLFPYRLEHPRSGLLCCLTMGFHLATKAAFCFMKIQPTPQRHSRRHL